MDAMENLYIHLKESQTIELKTAEKGLPASIYETYSSFANTKGGTIVIGVKESAGENILVGVENPSVRKKDFFNTISNKSKVSLSLCGDADWREYEIEGKAIIEINVPEAEAKSKPVYLDGNPSHCYVRRHDRDYRATEQERLAMELDSSDIKMDMQPNKIGLEFGDLNTDTLQKYRASFNQENKDNIFQKLDDESFFKAIGALGKKEGKYIPTNAAVLLFGNYIQIKQIFPEFNLDYREKFAGTERWDYRLDASSLSWSGNVYDFITMALNHIKPLLPNPFHLSDDGIHENGGALIYECVREGFVNAINNCDFYLSWGVTVIFEGTRITFRNGGRMAVPLEQALLGGYSHPRNEGVMNLLHLVKLGERAGTGIPNILLKMKALSYPKPLWVEEAFPSSTTLTLLLPSVKLDTNKASIEGKIMNQLLKDGPSGSSRIAKALGISQAAASRALNSLKEKGIIKDNGKATKGKLFFLA